jgi:hypothetical protein
MKEGYSIEKLTFMNRYGIRAFVNKRLPGAESILVRDFSPAIWCVAREMVSSILAI